MTVMLVTPISDPSRGKRKQDGPDWLHKIKFDGYRMHARLDAGRVQIFTRRGNVWTGKCPVIADAS